MNLATLISDNYEYAFNRVKIFTRNTEQAEDIMQEATICALRFGPPTDLSKFKQWFSRIAINVAKKEYRKRDHPRHRVDVDFDRYEANDKIMVETIDFVVKDIMRNFVETLPERQKLAFTLRIQEGLGFMDIAEIMNAPYDTVKANYRHAVMKLRRITST